MKTALFTALTLMLTLTSAFAANNKFASAHAIALDGVIEEGTMVTSTTYSFGIKSEVKEQLMYTIGQLNGLNGGSPDMSKTQISVQKVDNIGNGLYKVTYQAKLFIAWPRNVRIPKTYTFHLPAKGSHAGLRQFFNTFGSDENSGKKCLAWEAHDVTQGNFWYYYRPNKSSCPFRNLGYSNVSLVRTDVKLSVSNKNTEGKYPEYGKVWEDGKLSATLIFGKNESDSTSSWDAGVRAYEQTVRAVVQFMGQPTRSNVSLSASQYSNFNQGLKYPELRLEFNTRAGKAEVVLFLVSSIGEAQYDSEFVQKYNERTLVSDFISYSGHSGLGANIRTLARMGEFAAGQYQLFLVNGCDTFAYVDESLRNAHQRVNPGFSPDKFFDIITNAMPSYFHMNYRSNMSVLKALVGQKQTYKQILGNFDVNQRAVVTGEEDNNWPAEF